MDTERKIRISYDVVSPESAMDGDVEDRGWENEDGVSMMPDDFDMDDGLGPVDLAIQFLSDKYVEPSSSHFHSGIWYIESDGDTDYGTGKVKTESYHLKGFAESEEMAIFNAMSRR